ncbi:MAG: tetratricopeptide repeat protein [Kiritimatiellales bacterium]
MNNVRILRFLRCILYAGCFLFTAAIFAQTDEAPLPEESSASELATSILLQDARKLLEAGRNVRAIPYLEAIVVRLEDMPNADSAMVRATCMYQLGVSYMEARRFEEAAQTFQKFSKEYPSNESAEMARFLTLDAYSRMSGSELMKEYLAELEASGEMSRIFAMFQNPEHADMYRLAVISICSAYARSMDIENLEKFLPYCDKSARNDIGLNLALLEGGDNAFEKSEYITALELYRLIQLSEELKKDYDVRIAVLTAELAKQPPWVPQAQREAQDAQRASESNRLQRMKDDRSALDTQNYDNDVRIRMAQCYDAMERRWAAYEIFSYIYTAFPEGVQAEQCRFFAFQTLMALSEYEDAKKEGYTYLEMFPSGGFFDETALGLIHVHIMAHELDKADEFARAQLEREIPNRFADQICYLLGYIRFQQMDFEDALTFFNRTSKEWPTGIYAEESIYWVGMCNLFLGKFADAVEVFENYLNDPECEHKEFAEDVTYRLGMARYGLEEFDKAEKTFLGFLEQFPDSELRSEALSMLGDLRGAEGDLAASLEWYAQARAAALNMEQENYAVFQMARVYELDKQFESIISLMDTYGEKWGDQGDFAQAAMWTAKAWQSLGNDAKALDVRCSAIIAHGGNPELDSVDVMLKELIQDARKSGEEYAGGIKSRMAAPLADAVQNDKPLYYRLAALFARISSGTEHAQYAAPVLQETDLNLLSPLPLLLAAEELAGAGNMIRVQEVYDWFTKSFGTSDMLPDMVNIEIAALSDSGEFEAALKLANEAMIRFDRYAETGLTKKLTGDIFRRMKEYDSAVEQYNEFLTVREWRGPLTPQVLYWIGMCKFEQGHTEEAFAYFQRVYVLYEGYPEWVAKAYEASVNCLQKLGRRTEVVKTWQEMAANPKVAEMPEGRRAQEELVKLPGGRRD